MLSRDPLFGKRVAYGILKGAGVAWSGGYLQKASEDEGSTDSDSDSSGSDSTDSDESESTGMQSRGAAADVLAYAVWPVCVVSIPGWQCEIRAACLLWSGPFCAHSTWHAKRWCCMVPCASWVYICDGTPSSPSENQTPGLMQTMEMDGEMAN